MLEKEFINSKFKLSILLVVLMGFSIFLGFFLVRRTLLFHPLETVLASEDTTPPQISNINIEVVSPTSSVVSWDTDELSDAMINYGLDKNCGVLRDPSLAKTHSIVLENLLPSTQYYFRIVATDPSGNKSISSSYHFTTKSVIAKPEELEKITSPREKTLVEKAYGIIENINQPEALALLSEEIQKKAENVIQPPQIINQEPKVEVGIDYAIVSWETNIEANSIVEFVKESEYDPSLEDPYLLSAGDENEYVKKHEVRISSLTPGTVYHFRVVSKPKVGPSVKSDDFTFKTKPVLPEIKNLRLLKVQETSATLIWQTNVPCTSLVQYTNLRTKKTRTQGDPNFVTSHSFQLSNLDFGVSYSVIVIAEDEFGQKVKSKPLVFTTTKDQSPPVISKIHTESALYPGTENKIQTIISWETDEPASCQLFYHEGLAKTSQVYSFPKEKGYILRHVKVATDFKPATVYKFWIECEDRVGNKARSEDLSLLTPQQEKSILDIIIENFETTFGWMKKMKLGGQ